MKNIHAFTNKSGTVPHKLAFSVLRKQHFQGQVSNPGYSPLPFHVSEPDKRRRCLGWNQWENLARFQGNVFPGGKSLLGSGGTFSRAGKPCRAAQEHFPKRENLAALRRNISPSGKTLPRCAGTFSQAGKPCRAARQAFNDNMLAAVIPRSPTSGRMRYAPTVFSEILTRNDAIHHRTPNKSMVNMLGRIAYALHMSGHARRWNC